jgi:prevent-host-death family protein
MRNRPPLTLDYGRSDVYNGPETLEDFVMDVPIPLDEPSRIDEPLQVKEYSDVLSQVAAEGRPVIVRRNGEDLAAVVPLAHLELLREIAAREEAERLAARIDWDRVVKTSPPPQAWFDADDNPFEPEETPP